MENWLRYRPGTGGVEAGDRVLLTPASGLTDAGR